MFWTCHFVHKSIATVAVLPQLRIPVVYAPGLISILIDARDVREFRCGTERVQAIGHARLKQSLAGHRYHLELVHLIADQRLTRHVRQEAVAVAVCPELQQLLVRLQTQRPIYTVNLLNNETNGSMIFILSGNVIIKLMIRTSRGAQYWRCSTVAKLMAFTILWAALRMMPVYRESFSCNGSQLRQAHQ